MATDPIPEGYHSVTPYLTVKDAANAIAFYQEAFGAQEVLRLSDSRGKIGHAEIRIGDSAVMLADEYPDMDILGPESRGGATAGLALYVEDADAQFERAVKAGARSIRPVEDQFYGDRSGQLEDPFGHRWTIATHIEDVDAAEMQRRFDEWLEEQGG